MTTSGLPLPARINLSAFRHFGDRIRNRVGAEEDPALHWWRTITAVENLDSDVMEFVGRLKRQRGRRLWRYHLKDGRTFFVVFDHDANIPITIYKLTKRVHVGNRSISPETDWRGR